MKNRNKSALPIVGSGVKQYGLTKREYFVGLAMLGLLSNPSTEGLATDQICDDAISYGDGILEALEADNADD